MQDAAIAKAIQAQLQRDAGVILNSGDARIKFFKDRCIDIDKGTEVLENLKLTMESSSRSPNARRRVDRRQLRGTPTPSIASSVVAGNADDYRRAQNFQLPLSPVSSKDKNAQHDIGYESYNSMPIPAGYTRRIKLICTMSTALFPHSLQAQAETWRIADLGVLGVVDKIYELYKIHEDEIKQGLVTNRESKTEATRLKQQLITCEDSAKQQTIDTQIIVEQLSTSQTNCAKLQSQMEDMLDELKQARQRLDTSKEDTQRYADTIRKLTEELTSLKFEFENSRAQSKGLHDQLGQAQQELNSVREELHTAKGQLSEAHTEVEASTAQSSTYREQLEAVRASVSHELRNNIDFRLEIQAINETEALVQKKEIANKLKAQRSAAARRGQHTKACKNSACTLNACVQKRYARRDSFRRALRGAQESSDVTVASSVHTPAELICTLDGPYYSRAA